MHASTQERFKHCIPPQPTIDMFRPPFPRRSIPGASPVVQGETPSSNCRINITFRFYRPDFMSNSTPLCKCGVPCILRPDMKQRVDRRDDKSEAKGSKANKEKDSNDLKGKDDSTCHIKYWWTCYSGAQNEGKGCNMWKVMDVKAEGRGPFVGTEALPSMNGRSSDTSTSLKLCLGYSYKMSVPSARPVTNNIGEQILIDAV